MTTNLIEIAKQCPDLIVSIKVGDLVEANLMLIADTKRALEQQITDANTEKYPSSKEVMKILGVSDTTLWRWAKDGLLVPINVGGKRRYRMSDVKRFFENKK